MARLRTRKHKVVLSRSAGGDIGITIVLTLLGLYDFLFLILPYQLPTFESAFLTIMFAEIIMTNKTTAIAEE